MWDGLSLSQIARKRGAPGLRTLRRWCADNLFGFGKQYKETRLEQWTDRQFEAIDMLDRQIACGDDPRALEAYDRAYERRQTQIFVRSFHEAFEDREESRFTLEQRAILNLRREGWSIRKIGQYCDAFGVVLETARRPKMSRDNGTIQKRRRQSLARLPDEKHKEIVAWAGLGYSIRQIARDLDIPRATLQRWFLGPLALELRKVMEEASTLRAEMMVRSGAAQHVFGSVSPA